MGVNLDIRNKLPNKAIVFENESYDESIIGVSLEGGVIYSYERMIEEYMVNHQCTYEEAIDWVEYNTIRALAYSPQPKPMIVFEY